MIFVGDYFDSFNISSNDQINNFLDIIELKKSSGIDVVMLIGNHDYHYMPYTQEYYSGHQKIHHFIIQNTLLDNIEHLSMCHRVDNFLITHAGISFKWLSYWYKKLYNKNLLDYESIEKIVNDIWEHTPRAFKFTGMDPYGDSEESSPIWIRPKSLQRSNKDYLKNYYVQIVGHTQHNKIDIEGKTTGGKYYYIDTLETSGEYLILEDGKLTVNNLLK